MTVAKLDEFEIENNVTYGAMTALQPGMGGLYPSSSSLLTSASQPSSSASSVSADEEPSKIKPTYILDITHYRRCTMSQRAWRVGRTWCLGRYSSTATLTPRGQGRVVTKNSRNKDYW